MKLVLCHEGTPGKPIYKQIKSENIASHLNFECLSQNMHYIIIETVAQHFVEVESAGSVTRTIHAVAPSSRSTLALLLIIIATIVQERRTGIYCSVG